MSDPAPLARIASASARRSIIALLGPQFASTENDQSELYRPSTQLLREERQDLNNTWKESASDSAGVGLRAGYEKQDSGIPKTPDFGQRRFQDDELLRKQLLGSTSKLKQTGTQLRMTNKGLLEGRQLPGAKRNNDNTSSEEEQGRSGLGRSLKLHDTGKPRELKKKTKPKVETFESMQGERVSVKEEEDAESEKEAAAAVLSLKTRASTRPKSYLDQVLEAKRDKQQKKIMRQKLKSSIGQQTTA